MTPRKPLRFYAGSQGIIAWFALNVVICGSARAQVLTDDLAAELKARGDKAIASGDYAAAVDAYRKGDKIQHHAVFAFNLARALQGLGRYAEALDAAERFDREASPELKAKVSNLDQLIRELQSNVGTLVLEGDAHKARVRGNNRELGDYKPGQKLRCDAGPLDLVVTAEGFTSIERYVTITPGQTEIVALKFERNDDRATLTIGASAPGTRVSIDGRSAGQTPFETQLSPGKHRLRLEHPDFEPLDTDLVLTAKERRTVTYDLPRRAGILSKWWFWSGAAVLVTGVIVTGIALSTSKSPTPGDVEPGVISAPLLVPR